MQNEKERIPDRGLAPGQDMTSCLDSALEGKEPYFCLGGLKEGFPNLQVHLYQYTGAEAFSVSSPLPSTQTFPITWPLVSVTPLFKAI